MSYEAYVTHNNNFGKLVNERDFSTKEIIRVGELFIDFLKSELEGSNINEHLRDKYSRAMKNVESYLKKINPNYVSAGETAQVAKKWFDKDVPNLELDDLKGLKDVKAEFSVNILAPFLDKYKGAYKKYRGNKFSAQVLLYGPPGTGKTFAVKCLAGELGCHIAVVQTKDILANLVGDAEKNMAEVFEEAESYDRCIIFFDEIDAIAATRESDESRHTKGVLTTMLTYMDGFTKKAKEGQQRIIIAATNRPWVLDTALKRGGRFETQIYIDVPDAEARYQLVKLAFGKDEKVKNRINVPCAEDVVLSKLAEDLEGMSGADIAAVCKQIINKPLLRELSALQKNKIIEDFVTQEDCDEVKKNYINVITQDLRDQFVAYSKNMDVGKYKLIMREAQDD